MTATPPEQKRVFTQDELNDERRLRDALRRFLVSPELWASSAEADTRLVRASLELVGEIEFRLQLLLGSGPEEVGGEPERTKAVEDLEALLKWWDKRQEGPRSLTEANRRFVLQRFARAAHPHVTAALLAARQAETSAREPKFHESGWQSSTAATIDRILSKSFVGGGCSPASLAHLASEAPESMAWDILSAITAIPRDILVRTEVRVRSGRNA